MKNMSTFKSKLAMMESRLQALIEGGAARFFPNGNQQPDLASRLMEAMRGGIQSSPNGDLVAPNLFLLSIHPSQSILFFENRVVLEALSQTLYETGTEAGLYFNSSPVIRVVETTSVAPGEILVQASNSQDDLPQTSDIEINYQGDLEAIPPNAFLIVDGMQVFPLILKVVNIGRRLDNQLVIDDPRVSRVHVQLRAVRGRYVIFDLGSTGGTCVNGQFIHQCTLYPGDVITLSGVPLVFGQDPPSPGETQDLAPSPSDADIIPTNGTSGNSH